MSERARSGSCAAQGKARNLRTSRCAASSAGAGDIRTGPTIGAAGGATAAGPQKMFMKFATNLCEAAPDTTVTAPAQ
jgi:hypothetical protein